MQTYKRGRLTVQAEAAIVHKGATAERAAQKPRLVAKNCNNISSRASVGRDRYVPSQTNNFTGPGRFQSSSAGPTSDQCDPGGTGENDSFPGPAEECHAAHVHHGSSTVQCPAAAVNKPEHAGRQDTQQRSAAWEANWKRLIDHGVDIALRTLPQYAHLQQLFTAAVARQLSDAINNGVCNTCGLSMKQCSLVKQTAVTIVDQSCTTTIKVDSVRCTRYTNALFEH